jgi:hypothetical protein
VTRRILRGIRLYFFSFALVVAARASLCPPIAMAQSAPPSTSQSSSQSISCHGSQKARQVAELLFGRDVGHRLGVSERAWAHFVAREITPRFPDGFTVTNAAGQWRDSASGAIVHEASKRVEIVLPGAADDEARLDAAVAAYKRAFHQHSVLVIVQRACVSF